MFALCLFEDAVVARLAPLTHTRHVADLRLGMYTLAELQTAALGAGAVVVFHARPHVAGVTAQEHPGRAVNRLPEDLGVLFVNGRYVPEDDALVARLRAAARPGEPARAFRQGDDLVAAWCPTPPPLPHGLLGSAWLGDLPEETVEGARLLAWLPDLLDVEERLVRDAAGLGRPRREGTLHDGARVVGEAVWMAPGAEVRPGAVVTAADGPVVLAEGALVEENAVVRGPCWIGPRALVKAGARVDGSAVGPVCKVGGEVHASVLLGYASKVHDGYLGNSVLGRWCNLGAGTSTSNLRNDYAEVTLWDAAAGAFRPTGRQFVGLFMGDHAKSAILTAFNTGTVVGVACNVFGAGFPPRHLPSFSWGGAGGLETYRLEKALRVAEAVMARRGVPLTEADRAMLTAVFEQTAAARAALP